MSTPASHLQDYYQQAELAERWFGGAWQDPQHWRRWPLAAWTGQRQELAAMAIAALQAVGADACALAAAKSLAQPEVVAVVAGQQPAYGLGPLYNVLKISHCIAVASHLRQQGQAAVPIFWCASDDHDHDEAAGCRLLQRDGRLRSLRRPMQPAHCALHRIAAEPGWETLISALQESSSAHLGQDWLRSQAPQADEGMGAWMCRVMSCLSAGTGLVCLEARHLRPLWRPGLDRALNNWPTAALQQRQKDLRAAGWPTPLDLQQPPLFADTSQGRRAVDPSQALDMLQRDPDSLSPGAGLRPVFQQLALPCAVYCAGPGEITYHAALGPLYEAMGAIPPRLLPRLSLGIIPAHIGRGLAAWNLQPEALHPQQPLPTPPSDESDRRILQIFDQAAEHLTREAVSLDESRQKRVRQAQRALGQQRQRLAQSLMRGQRQRQHLASPGALRDYLYPRGGGQDRSLSSAQALYEWGPGLFQTILQHAQQHPIGGKQDWLWL